jgi:hypothetical protein
MWTREKSEVLQRIILDYFINFYISKIKAHRTSKYELNIEEYRHLKQFDKDLSGVLHLPSV